MKTIPPAPADLQFDGPATYRIVVQGTLDENWSERVGGMTVSSVQTAAGSQRTELTGPLLDQAALQGVLETLYDLHMAILNVEKIDGPEQERRSIFGTFFGETTSASRSGQKSRKPKQERRSIREAIGRNEWETASRVNKVTKKQKE